MLELILILRAAVEEVACRGEGGEGQKKCGKPMPPIKFSELKRLIYDVLWREERIAIYATVWEMRRELERLADLGLIKFESDEVKIEPDEFLEKTEPYLLVIRRLIGGNEYLDHVIRRIEDRARRYAADIERGKGLVQHLTK
jgi:hypothetical protein